MILKKTHIILIILLLQSLLGNTQVWRYPYSPFERDDYMNSNLEATKGRKSQTIYEISKVDTLIYRYEYDTLGRVVMKNTDGIAVHYTYDEHGNWIKRYYGEPMKGVKREIEYRENLITSILTSGLNSTYNSTLKLKYDDQSRVTEVSYNDSVFDLISYQGNKMSVIKSSNNPHRQYDRIDYYISKDSVYYELFFFSGRENDSLPTEMTTGIYSDGKLIEIRTIHHLNLNTLHVYKNSYKNAGLEMHEQVQEYKDGELTYEGISDIHMYNKKGEKESWTLLNSEGVFKKIMYINKYY